VEQFDPFTFIASIVNFIVLVVLLRVFLYKRIVRAMDARKQRIHDRWDEAETARDAAQNERSRYEELRREIERERDKRIAEVRDEVSELRREMLSDARDEVNAEREKMHEALERERQETLRGFQRRAAQEITGAVRRTLADLADRDLETQMLRASARRIQSLDPDARNRLRRGLESSAAPVTVHTSFEAEESLRKELVETLRSSLDIKLAEEQLRFETDPETVCGIEITTATERFAWSVDDYVHRFDEDLSEALSRRRGSA
jgi:F-type H+-transporting ATPase subunit b